ncbi:hypothetical protein AMELA_G00147730 [Ameiurus melas]|uniref:Uncharacterized protein n=1 Tax=Ameiurus melas TaxID=219545 RepID=A0A7J6AGQ0_AMEME|nr:hypothetical protein AMELA_G00147730 [Ameiurus melas]
METGYPDPSELSFCLMEGFTCCLLLRVASSLSSSSLLLLRLWTEIKTWPTTQGRPAKKLVRNVDVILVVTVHGAVMELIGSKQWLK